MRSLLTIQYLLNLDHDPENSVVSIWWYSKKISQHEILEITNSLVILGEAEWENLAF